MYFSINIPALGAGGSGVQILSPRPFKIMGYGLGRSPFFVVGNTMGNKWRANKMKHTVHFIKKVD